MEPAWLLGEPQRLRMGTREVTYLGISHRVSLSLLWYNTYEYPYGLHDTQVSPYMEPERLRITVYPQRLRSNRNQEGYNTSYLCTILQCSSHTSFPF